MRHIKSYPNDAAIQGAVDSNLLGHPYVALDDELHKIDWDGKRRNYSMEYLTVEALEDGNFYVRNENFDYSLNGGEWTTGIGHQTIALSRGDTVRFKHETNSSFPGMFSGNTMLFNVYGNIESMEYGNNFTGATTVKLEDAFDGYFSGCSGLVNAGNLVLPAMTLKKYCYSEMFTDCTSLTTSPNLPATTITSGCYGYMFYGCTSLVTVSELPATSLTASCYENMFDGCISLTTAPELPATTLAESCYSEMFAGCESLTAAQSILPATTLEDGCYFRMFGRCTSLTTAPELPATTLADSCYNNMFEDCESLNYIKCFATETTTGGYLMESTRHWTDGVSNTGTFVKAANMSDWTTGVDGIPRGWTVIDAQ